MSMMFQWPAVGVGTFTICTSMTNGFDFIARSSAGLNSFADWMLTPSAPYAFAIAA